MLPLSARNSALVLPWLVYQEDASEKAKEYFRPLGSDTSEQENLDQARSGDSDWIEKTPWLSHVRHAYYEPFRHLVLNKYHKYFSR
ncbi:unnamed protein product [Heligmosomoides polygyrus]|uniref:Ring_hydroxyl_A domain-containing protein n=1 Tax=Heligmosomoides polygyrus TaxID=6339 RepID=A0A183GP81_HELPZ|nr:unnamed protein product [Heligmosomoides polygyrus]